MKGLQAEVQILGKFHVEPIAQSIPEFAVLLNL